MSPIRMTYSVRSFLPISCKILICSFSSDSGIRRSTDDFKSANSSVILILDYSSCVTAILPQEVLSAGFLYFLLKRNTPLSHSIITPFLLRPYKIRLYKNLLRNFVRLHKNHRNILAIVTTKNRRQTQTCLPPICGYPVFIKFLRIPKVLFTKSTLGGVFSRAPIQLPVKLVLRRGCPFRCRRLFCSLLS